MYWLILFVLNVFTNMSCLNMLTYYFCLNLLFYKHLYVSCLFVNFPTYSFLFLYVVFMINFISFLFEKSHALPFGLVHAFRCLLYIFVIFLVPQYTVFTINTFYFMFQCFVNLQYYNGCIICLKGVLTFYTKFYIV